MRAVAAAGVLALLGAVVGVVLIGVIQTIPIRIDTVGAGSCAPGAGDCRRVGVIQVVPSPAVGPGTPVPTPTARPEFAAADFPLIHAVGLGSDHVVLPGCGNGDDVGYYAYAHPQSHGRLDGKAGFIIGGVPQQHALALQLSPGYVEIEGVKHMVMVSRNMLECDRFEGQVVEVKP